MRTYLIFKEKAERWNTNEEIRSILAEIETLNGSDGVSKFDPKDPSEFLTAEFDRTELASFGLKYERLDQLTMDVLFGVD
jgi:xylose isomerase